MIAAFEFWYDSSNDLKAEIPSPAQVIIRFHDTKVDFDPHSALQTQTQMEGLTDEVLLQLLHLGTN